MTASTSNYVPLYEGDSLIRDASAQPASNPRIAVFERMLDAVIAFVRRLDHAWMAGLERARMQRIEAMLEGSKDVYEVERRLVALERKGWL